MKKLCYTILLFCTCIVMNAQNIDFIEDANKYLGVPMTGIVGGPNGTGKGVVGAIGGVVDIGGMGAATYSIPIELPSAIGNMKPSLSVVYNSQSSNGLLGWGWTIGGLSAITRVNKNLFLDGRMKGVDFNDDGFAIDGQRLIQLDEYYDHTEYRTEVDGMSKIVSYFEANIVNGPAKFKVWTADGLIMEYGFTEESRMEKESNSNPGKLEVGLWLLNKIEDRDGNYIEYQYVIGGANYFLKKIRYTGNSNALIYPRYQIELNYFDGTREDEETAFIGNHALHQSKLLKSISIQWLSDPTWTYEEIASYAFDYYGIDYNQGYLYYRLKDVIYTCGGFSYNPTTIAWGNNDYTLTPSSYKTPIISGLPLQLNNKMKVTGDFNGDGFVDIIVLYKEGQRKYANVYLNDGLVIENGQQKSSFHYHQKIELDIYTVSIKVADFNGDGRDDMVTVSRVPEVLKDYVKIFPFLTKWTSSGEWKLDYAEKLWDDVNRHIFISREHEANLMIGDFLGRGKTEMMMQIPDGNIVNPRFLYITYQGNNQFYLTEKKGSVLPGTKFVPADYNGDGIAEIWCNDNEANKTGLLSDSNEKSIASIYRMTSQNAASQINTGHVYTSRHNFLIGDFNGDGHGDVLSNERVYESGYYKHVWKINFFKETEMYWDAYDISLDIHNYNPGENLGGLFDSPSDYPFYHFYEVLDMNGDGKSDFVLINGNKLYVYYAPLIRVGSDRAVFSSKQVFDLDVIGLNGLASKMTLCCGNFLGNESMCIMGNGNIFCLPPLSNRYSVNSITDGMGNKTTFEYDYLRTFNSSIYNWSKLYDQPEIDVFSLPFSIKALKSFSNYNAIAETPVVTTKYYYRNALVHRKGHGFIGFLKTISTSSIQGHIQDSIVTDYTTEPLESHRATSIKSQRVFNALGRLVTQVVYTNSYLEHWNNPHVYVPTLLKKQTLCFSPDNDSEEFLSNSITENKYIDSYYGGIGLYRHTIKLTDVYEGLTDNRWVGNASDCNHITHTRTVFQPDSFLEQWIINRPDTTIVTAWKRGDDRISKSLITYDYKDDNSYHAKVITSYPGGNCDNENGLATSTTYDYDIVGNVVSETLSSLNGFPSPRMTTYTYKNYRFPKTETNPVGYVSRTAFDSKYGELITSTDCNGLTTYYNRSDHLGTSDYVRYPDLTYGCAAKRWVVNDNDAPEKAAYYTWKRISGEMPTKVFYDAAGRELRTVTYDGIQYRPIYQDTEYNNMGLVFRKSLPYFTENNPLWSSYYYDGFLRPIDTYYPNGTNCNLCYDGLKTTSRINTPDGDTHTSIQVRNYLGQKTMVKDELGTEVTYNYYPDGKLRWTQVGEDNKTRIRLEYDDAGNRTMLHDPNYGKIVETYDAFGQLKTSLTPKQDLTEYQYDQIGRLIKRIEHDNLHHTTKDTYWIYSNSGTQKGLLSQIIYGADQQITFLYDNFHLNRIDSKIEKLFGKEYQTSYTYDDNLGFPLRVKSVTYPTEYTSYNEYKAMTGVLDKITDGQGEVLWQTLETDANGQITRYKLGNGVESTRYYSPQTGLLNGIESNHNGNVLQSLGYEYDYFGNLNVRRDKRRNLEERFYYDELDRLESIKLNGVSTGLTLYDELGRMTFKQADGEIVFSSAEYDYIGPDGQLRPHAISSANMTTFSPPSANYNIDYTMFDKVSNIDLQDAHGFGFDYGYDRQRIRMTVTNGGILEMQKTYVDNCEYIQCGGLSSNTYLAGPLGAFAIIGKTEASGNGNESITYLLKDNLGSWTTFVDASGCSIQEQSFDAWGVRRNPETWSGNPLEDPIFDRGFTGHEHLFVFDAGKKDIGIINMNGRMYDPMMSTFLSVDSYVQAPDNSQNFNRYAYCLNNPLKYVDPSGEELCAAAVMAIAAAVSVATQCIQNYCYDRPIYQDLVKAAAVGAIQGMFSYGIGYVGEAITAAVEGAGGVACSIAFKAVAHGTLAGVATLASGGHFWQGFASGAASSLVSSCIGAACAHSCSVQWQRAAMIAGGALAGGVSSTIVGGNFWEGVCNGLICAGLNHAMHLVGEIGPKIVHVLHELKNFENSMQKDRGPYFTSHFNMCKYAVMEAIAYYFGDYENDQWGFKDTGDKFIADEKKNNRPEPLLSAVFEKCGFSVDIVPEDKAHVLWPKALDNGKPVVFDYMADDNTRHTATLIALGRDAGGNLMYRLADPMLGVCDFEAGKVNVNVSYVFYGRK